MADETQFQAIQQKMVDTLTLLQATKSAKIRLELVREMRLLLDMAESIIRRKE